MHAVLITFRSSVYRSELAEPFADYARALADAPGLVAKTWISGEECLGGFHLFETASDVYLDGPLLGSVRVNPAFGDFRIVRYDVLGEVSAPTNGLGSTAPLVR